MQEIPQENCAIFRSKMRILYIHQHFATPASASGTRSFVFAKKLVEAGHQVTIITSDGYLPKEYKDVRQFEIDGVTIINRKSGYSLLLDFRERVSSFLQFMIGAVVEGLRIPADLVFATSTPLTVAIPALLIKWKKRIPFVFELRDLWPGVPIELGVLRNPFLIWAATALEKTAYRFADRIVCISEGISRNVKVPGDKKIVIPTGCDLSRGVPAVNDSWKREVGIRTKRLFVLTGAIGEANAPDYLIDAAKDLQVKGRKDIAIALIGAGSAKDRVKRLKETYGLQNVHLFNPVPKSKIPEILGSADGGIILHGVSRLYRETAMPNKFFDYIAAGLPVIFNFEGPLKEQILKYKAGYYVNYRRPEQLSDTLAMLSQRDDECRNSGKNAFKMAKECFDQEKMADRFVKALEEVGNRLVP